MRLVDRDQSLMIDLAGAPNANELMYTANFVDIQRASRREKGGASDGLTTSTTAKDMVAAPNADVDREIQALTIHNADDTSATVSVILRHGAATVAANLKTVMKVTLLTLETLVFTKGEGWAVLTADGALKASAPAVGLSTALANGRHWMGNASGVAAQVTKTGDVTESNAGVTAIGVDKVLETMVADSDGTSGLYIRKTALALYDFGTDGGVQGAITLTDAVTIPDNAVVRLVGYEVLTTATSGTDAATIKLNLVTDGDLSTAIAISDAKNPWDGPAVFCAHGGGDLGAFKTAPTPQKTTGARLVQITVAGGEDLTAGKIIFELEYHISS